MQYTELEIAISKNAEDKSLAYKVGAIVCVIEDLRGDIPPNKFSGILQIPSKTIAPFLTQAIVKEHEKGVNMLCELICQISTFPDRLSMNERAIFWIGYYHTKNIIADHRTKKKGKKKQDEVNVEPEA